MDPQFQQLLDRLREIDDLRRIISVLGWDQSTYMPPGGAEARARQLATVQRLAHERLTGAETGRLLDELQTLEAGQPYDSFEASLLRVTRREYNRWREVPAALMAAYAENRSQCRQVWTEARPRSDFAAVRPWLERNLEITREIAGYLPRPTGAGVDGEPHVADALIAIYEPDMTALAIRRIFAELRAELVPLVQTITAREPADDGCLRRHFPAAEQLAFSEGLVARMGYDFQRGRQDLAPHPFTTRFSLGDVRITTRVREDYLAECLFSSIHEAGHALYEQGCERRFEATLLAGGTSHGVHESQSRLWENLIGRGRPFWEHFYPELQAAFPAQLGAVGLDEFYRAINKVERSLIRTDADEVTYNLHVMLRFDLELALLEGSLAIRDLPEAWNARMQSDLDVTPPNDADGVLQDVHWYSGLVGGSFQGYTLGNILSAQFYEAALRAEPGIPAAVAAGEFAPLNRWLTEQIYRHGSTFTPAELVQRVTGGPLAIGPYMRYLREKYGELYALPA
jgi:carboxypeptidase Taq